MKQAISRIINKDIKQIEELPLPENINIASTEKYYLSLSSICRLYFKNSIQDAVYKLLEL